MEKFLVSLDSANKMLKTADHMTYVTFPLLKDKRLLIKILNEIYGSVLNMINSELQYEYYNKRVIIYDDAGLNFKTFREKCAPRFGITTKNIDKIIELFTLIEKHKQSPLEFVKNEKFVIMSNNSHTDIVTIESLKEFLILAKEIFKKTETVISSKNR